MALTRISQPGDLSKFWTRKFFVGAVLCSVGFWQDPVAPVVRTKNVSRLANCLPSGAMLPSTLETLATGFKTIIKIEKEILK